MIITPTQVIATHPVIKQGLEYLSNRCDGASSIDEVGLNKFDADFRRELSSRCDRLSYELQFAALKLLAKYRKQLKDAAIILPTQVELQAYFKGSEEFKVAEIGTGTFTVENTLKGHLYELDVMGEIIQCDCSPVSSTVGRACKHIKVLQDFLTSPDEYVPDTEEISSEYLVQPDPSPLTAMAQGWIIPSTGGWDYAPHLIAAESSTALTITAQEFLDAKDEDLIECEVVGEEESDRDSAEILPGITLNAGQLQAVRECAKFLSSNETMHILTGMAGSGKTVTLQAVLTLLRQYGDNRAIVFSAPTNKAVKVLRKMAARWELQIDSLTCHKLLGLKPHKVEGRLDFEPDWKQEPTIGNYSLIIVDECSMLPKALWHFLTDALTFGQKIIFCGDIDQAPPVGESIAQVFEKVQSISRLTEIVRYSGATAIAVENQRRTIALASSQVPKPTSVDKGEKGVFVLDKKAWEYKLLQLSQSEEAKRDPDFIRAIAFSNKRVKALSSKVREKLFDSFEQFVIGERLIAQEAYACNETTVIETSEEGEIINLSEDILCSFAIWRVKLRLDDGEIVEVPCLKEESQAGFNQKIQSFANASQWREYWEYRELFANLCYPYAITSHKSQGSTYKNVFVDVSNFTSTYSFILRGKSEAEILQKIKERNQLLYTAYSRASNKLFLVF